MKIRTVTYGVSLALTDFDEQASECLTKLEVAASKLKFIVENLTSGGYDVQTSRLSFNRVEDWLDLNKYEEQLKIIADAADRFGVNIISLGSVTTTKYVPFIPKFFEFSDKFFCAVQSSMGADGIYEVPDFELCVEASKVCLEMSKFHGKMSGENNFRFCIGFNIAPGCPFYPASYYHTAHRDGVSIGLENGYFLFLAFHGVTETVETVDGQVTNKKTAFTQARNNLKDVIFQGVKPLQIIVEKLCMQCDIDYMGVDASLNPGLTQLDSIGAGIEWLIMSPEQQLEQIDPDTKKFHAKRDENSRTGYFGSFSTLSVVSLITSALKQLLTEEGDEKLKLIGYNGLMLPVMEDIVLAKRAAGNVNGPGFDIHNIAVNSGDKPSMYTLRDLLVFSTICGVGLDTVPVPGNITVEELANIYLEVGSLAFRLNKPLSCR